jgi:heme exporter protein CcmD
MNTDPNSGFVLAAYLVAFVVLTGMIVATVADYLGLKKNLARLAERAGPPFGGRDPGR